MPPDIFYVEDDYDFAFLTKHALGEVQNLLSINIIPDSKKALEELIRLAEERRKPKIILLDLNLPGLSGLDLLKKIREIPFLRYTPVIFFSTSDNPKDIRASIEFGANAFVTKPSGYVNLVNCLRAIHEFWFKTNTGLL